MPLSKNQVDTFEKVIVQLESLYDELSVLSKKSPRDALNLFKLRLINQVIQQANCLLGSPYKPFSDFELFDEDEIPQNSDVVLMLAQYKQCLEKLKVDNVKNNHGRWEWLIDGDLEETVRTSAPKRLL